MKNALVVLGFLLAFVAGYFISQKYSFKIETNNPTQKIIIETPVPTDTMVGNDSDEHGCKGSAGYSWCEEKQKCLRVWEEPCEKDNGEEKIKQAILNKHGWNGDEVEITISKNDGTFARGGIKEKLAVSGGMFLAKKVNSQWEVVFEGNGAPDCSLLKNTYQFPAEFLTGVCD